MIIDIPDNMSLDTEQMRVVAKTLQQELCRLTRVPLVLLVEDDPSDADLSLRELSKFKCQVTTVFDSEQAVIEISKTQYDVVLLDQKMPKILGSEILEKTIHLHQQTRFIIVSGSHPDAPILSRALRAGAKLIFEKPLNGEKLSLLFEKKAA